MDDVNKHGASSALTGYLFQCRCALLKGLQAVPNSPELAISIEKFDDIAFETVGEPVELVQTKHHLGKKTSLSDSSVDLWKTLLIWSSLVAKNTEALFRLKFVLLTTAVAQEGSAASYLRLRDRNEEKADKRLLQIASQSKSKGNVEAYQAYRSLPETIRLNLLKATMIFDGSPNIVDVRDDISREVFYAAPRGQIDNFVERLEGWWFGLLIKALAGTAPKPIPVLAIDQRIDELREEFKRAALPVDYKNKLPPSTVIAELDKRPFVRQLRKIQIGPQRIEFAIRDYYRASEQRSRWAREDLLVDGEVENYERELIEAWEPRHAAMVDELKPECGPDKKIAAAQSLFKWVEREASFPLRTVREHFLTHGSYHILSNRYILGWHPEFRIDPEALRDDLKD